MFMLLGASVLFSGMLCLHLKVYHGELTGNDERGGNDMQKRSPAAHIVITVCILTSRPLEQPDMVHIHTFVFNIV